MNLIRQEVRELVRIFERIHLTMKGSQLSQEEKELVIMCAQELIASASSRNQPTM